MPLGIEKPLIDWLRDAHAMETAQIATLEHHARGAMGHPEFQARIERHIDETRRQADLIKQCLQRHGQSPPTLKEAVGAVTGFFQGVQPKAAKDELVKNTLMDYAAEHFEIACYRSLITGARAAGDLETAHICEQILREEEEMATWLEHNIPMVTEEYVAAARVA